MSAVPGARVVEVQGQAKLNLRLRILAREETGFHQLETLLLRIGLADTVRVRRTESGHSLDVAGDVDLAALGPAEKNLAWRAASAYQSASGDRHGVAIEIHKRIPIGGGLGGGSADAAAVLRAMEAMALEPLGPRRLLAIAATLGADVPFLASEAAYALAWGRGERLLAMTPPVARPVLLVVPAFRISTADAYGWLAADRAGAQGAGTGDPALLDASALSDWAEIGAVVCNDFTLVVGGRHPEIAAVLDSLREDTQVECAEMAGSGSTLFAVGRGATISDMAAPQSGSLIVRTILTHTATRVESVSAIE